jgi:hypothetical protein
MEYPNARGRPMKKFLVLALAAGLIGLAFSAAGCKKKEAAPTIEELEEAKLEAEQTAEEAAAAAEAAAKLKPPPPKINEDVYVEITARSVLIREKYKDDMPQAEKEVEAVYEKFGLSFTEYKEFEKKLTPQRLGELQRKISDFMQKILSEYR